MAQKVRNNTTSHMLLTADGHPALPIPPYGRVKGRVDDGPANPEIELSDEQIEIYGAVKVDAGRKGGPVSQLEYFAERGLEFV